DEHGDCHRRAYERTDADPDSHPDCCPDKRPHERTDCDCCPRADRLAPGRLRCWRVVCRLSRLVDARPRHEWPAVWASAYVALLALSRHACEQATDQSHY